MTTSFEGKVAFVTGGASGIGRAVAEAFANEGARVAIVDLVHNAEDCDPLAGGDRRVRRYQCDVRDSDAVRATVLRVTDELGGLDCCFNNAGLFGPVAPLHKYPEQAFADIVGVHLFGTFLCMKHQIREMAKRGAGTIVNVSSIAGLFGTPGTCAYSAAKHGIIGLTKSAAAEYGSKGIRINAICPGLIDTPMTRSVFPDVEERGRYVHPIGRAGRPDEVAALVLWLCSGAASLVTGAVIPIDGGYTSTLQRNQPSWSA